MSIISITRQRSLEEEGGGGLILPKSKVSQIFNSYTFNLLSLKEKIKLAKKYIYYIPQIKIHPPPPPLNADPYQSLQTHPFIQCGHLSPHNQCQMAIKSIGITL